jgi:AsmA protein
VVWASYGRDAGWPAATAPFPSVPIERTVGRVTVPILVHDAPAITLVSGEIARSSTIPELVQSWFAAEIAPAEIIMRTPEALIGGGEARKQATIRSDQFGVPGNFATIEIIDGTVRIIAPGGRELHLSDVDARLERRMGGHELLATGTANLFGRKIEFVLESGDDARNAGHTHPMSIRIRGAGMSLELGSTIVSSGTTQEAGTLRFHAESADDLAAWLGLSFATALAGPLTLEGSLSVEDGLFSLDAATIQLAGNSGKGSLRLQLTSGRALLDATLAFARLDLAGAEQVLRMALETETVAPATVSPAAKGPGLAAVDIDLRLSADRIRLGDFATGRGAISATWRDHGLTVQLAGLELYGGEASGQLRLGAVPGAPRMELMLELDGVELASLLTAAGYRAPLTATSQISIALSAAGRTWREARERLTGRIAVRASERGWASGGLGRMVHAVMGDSSAVSGNGGQVIDGLDWQMAIENGVATRQRLAFDLDGVRYDGLAETVRAEAVAATRHEPE